MTTTGRPDESKSGQHTCRHAARRQLGTCGAKDVHVRQWQRKLDFPWEAGTAQTRIADLTLHMHPTVPNGMQILSIVYWTPECTVFIAEGGSLRNPTCITMSLYKRPSGLG